MITFMAIIVAARYRWCNARLHDTYITNTLTCLLLGALIRQHIVQIALARATLITAGVAQQLAALGSIFACTEFIGFTALWSRLSTAETRRRQRYYRLAAVILSAAYLIAATRARTAGQDLEISGGWDGVLAWCFFLAMGGILCVQIVRRSLAELRTATLLRERLAVIVLLLIGTNIAASHLQALGLAVTDQLGWTSTAVYRLQLHWSQHCVNAIVLGTMAAMPCMMKLRENLGLDPISRRWRKLQPLRHSMTNVVPESIFVLDHDDQQHRKTTLQLHHSVVEIRDAILQLRPYYRDIAPRDLARFLQDCSVPTHEHDAATHALHLAHAAKAKTTGAPPRPFAKSIIMASRATTLEEETTELLKLAKWWPAAYAAA